MKTLLALALVAAFTAGAAGVEPLALHPANPHYFIFREKPALLISSGEHYGAVLNADFDYVKYLDTLAADGLNLTRTFSGAYCEPAGAFQIAENTLAPANGRLLAPWPRSAERGYANGGRKFDLMKWDDAYFARLRDFVAQASTRGIVVEMNLFCPMYDDKQWALSPMNAANNINGVGAIGKHDVYDVEKNGELQMVQEALVRKIVRELNDADNVYYEICNEPYFGGVTNGWQRRIAEVIVDTERTLPHTHLISQNIANGHAKITRPDPAVSIFNFHYASPPLAVAENYELNKVIGMNETGFKGTGADYYRGEAWEFMIAGGGLYNHLDYSFSVGHEDGSLVVKAPTPGGGGAAYRRQMKVLADFLGAFDFVKMKPAREMVRLGAAEKARAQVLAEPGRQYAIYLKNPPASVGIDMPAGDYESTLVICASGERAAAETFQHAGGVKQIELPAAGEMALRIVRAGK
jgi:hypothetical protein